MAIISMYSIVKEIMGEEGKSIDSDEISKNTSAYSRKLKEILQAFSIDIDYFKSTNNTFCIPVEAKESVKKILLLYTSKVMKKIRNHEFESLTFPELKEIVGHVKNLLSYTLRGPELITALSTIDAITQYSVKKPFNEIESKSMANLNKNMRELLKPRLDRALSPQDRIEILNYYKIQINKLNQRMQEIIDKVIEYRDEEIAESINFNDLESDVKIPIHINVLKDILNGDQAIKMTAIDSLKDWLFEDISEDIFCELKTLNPLIRETQHFKLVTNNGMDNTLKYRPSKEVIDTIVNNL